MIHEKVSWVDEKMLVVGKGKKFFLLPLQGGWGVLGYYGCYTLISGRLRRILEMQGRVRFEGMPAPLVKMNILRGSQGIWPIPEKKDKNNILNP